MRTQALFTVYIAIISALIISLLLVVTSPNAHAADAASIGVVNIQKIMRESKAAQSVRSQMQTKQKDLQSQLDAKEKELQKEDQELAKSRASLSKEQFEAKYKEFRNKVASAQSQVQKNRVALGKALNEALGTIQSNIASIVGELAKEKGLSVAISSSQVIYSAPQMDITEEVLTRLNGKLASVNVNFGG